MVKIMTIKTLMMMNEITPKTWLKILGLSLCFGAGFFTHWWLHKCPVVKTTSKTSRTTTTTVTTKSKIDTIYVPGPLRYVTLKDTIIILDADTKLSRYNFSYPDLTGTFAVTYKGTILDNTLAYQVTQKEITKTDSIFINKFDSIYIENTTEKILPRKTYIFAGFAAQPLNLQAQKLSVGVTFKNSWSLAYSTGFTWNSGTPLQHWLDLRVPLTRP
jgi:hypothetical protein